ncbi:MAG TPA: T3SS effector HopA1 family protein [Candidatus Elarobacter sp.]|nr:T3SS effector HopA1 family protein [Candidatus Elarobacter sp.]
MNAYEAQLRAIAGAVEIVSAERARVRSALGERSEVAIANERGAFLGLAEALYAGHYSALSYAAPVPGVAPDAFFAELRAANPIGTRYQGGAYLAPRETVSSPFGHYVILGRTIHDASSGRQVRFYWSLAPQGAATFLREIGTRLERRRIPFQAKVPARPDGYGRTDAGVLYLGDEDVAAASDAIAATYRAVRANLRAPVPLFARELAPGLSFAESPPTRDSFGMHRCDLIAEGLVWAFERNAANDEARFGVLCERLTKYGFDLDSFERNPSSRYPYPLDAIVAEAA